jgi:hypothetical protein
MSTSPLHKPPKLVPSSPNRQRQRKRQFASNQNQNQPGRLRLRRVSLFLVVFLVSFAVLSAVEGLMGTAGGRNTAIAAPPPALTWTAPAIIGPTQPDTQPFWQIAIRVRPTDGMGFIIGEGAGGTTLQPQNKGLTFLQNTSNLSAALTNINDAERNTQQFPSLSFASDGSAFVTYRHLPEGAGWRGYMRYMAPNEVWQPGVDIGAARNWGVGATSAELYTTGNAYSAVENKAYVTGELFDTNTSARHWGFAVLTTSAATGIVPGTERIVAANKPSGGITSVPVMCVSPVSGDIHIAGQWGPDVAAISRIGGIWQAAPTSLTPSKPADWAVRKDVNIACAPDGYVYVVWPSDDKTFGIGRFNPSSKVWEPLYFDALAPLAPGLPALATRYANVLVTSADPSRVWVAFNTNGGGFGTGSGTFLVSSGDRGQSWSVGAADVQQVFSTPAGTLNIGNGIAYVPQTGRIMLAHTIQLPDGSRRSEFTTTNESILPPPPTATATAIPPTATATATARPPTVTATATAIPPTVTATATVAQPSATATVAQPSPTATSTSTSTSTSTATATATVVQSTATLAPTATATATTSSGGGGGTSNAQATATALAYIRGQLTADARNAFATITANAARNTTTAPSPTPSPTAQPTVQVQPATTRPVNPTTSSVAVNPPVAVTTTAPRPATATPRPTNTTGTGAGMGVVATSQPLPQPQVSSSSSPITGTNATPSVSTSTSASAGSGSGSPSVSPTPRALPAFDLSGNSSSSSSSSSSGAAPVASVIAQPLPVFGLLAPTPTPLPPTPTPTAEPLPTVTPILPTATAEPLPTATEVPILPADTGAAPGEGLAIAAAVPGAGAVPAISSYASTTNPIVSINAVEGGFGFGFGFKLMLSLGIAGLALFLVASGWGSRFLLSTKGLRLRRSKGGS